jgi:spermidine/putrescine transport system substrate-binding protein
VSRRDFLKRAAAAGIALPSLPAVLSACASANPYLASGLGSEAPIFGTRKNPATLQTYDDNPPIDSDLEPEAGPLVLYNWEQYIWKPVLNDFAKKYGVEWRLETFYNMEEAIQKILTGQVTFDVFFPTVDIVPRLVAGKLLRPLNHDYLPNLKNIYPDLADPFYDKGSQYTVPYTLYATGIAWRKDLIPMETEELRATDNPWSTFWDPAKRGKVGIYDVSREALLLGMFHGVGTDVDVNTSVPEELEAGKNALIELGDLVDVRTTIDGTYDGIPTGRFGMHQAWSGDIQAAPFYAKDPATEAPLFRYYWPARDGFGGTAENDTITIPRSAKNPVLAHHFLNFMLEEFNAVKNWTWVGYQPPQKGIDPVRLFEEGYPGLKGYFAWEWKGKYDNLSPTIITEKDLAIADRQIGLDFEIDALWQTAYASFKSGA